MSVPPDPPPCLAWTAPEGCRWPPERPPAYDEAVWDVLVASAWESACQTVWALTGRRFGRCSHTATWDFTGGGMCLPTPMLYEGRWYNVTGAVYPCCELTLEPSPVWSVESVTLDGEPYTDWLLDGNRLLNLDGCWPAQQPCKPARLLVTWTAGADPDPLLPIAAAELAAEVIAPCTGAVCRLPSNATSVTRQGVTVSMGDPTMLLEAGLTGLPMLDLAIRTFNPNRLAMRSRVYSPDIPRPRYRLPV